MVEKQTVINKPAPARILEKIQETNRITTFQFAVPGVQPVPGQFFMVWIPGVDEIPMSVSGMDTERGIYEISVSAIGDATRALCAKNPGDLIGIRGPFGNGFNLDTGGEAACVIAGGVGMAAVRPIILDFLKRGKPLVVINAARTQKELLYHAFFEKNLVLETSYFTSTDDGSCGEKCFGHERFSRLLDGNRITVGKVYTCGPEIMMRHVSMVCEKHGLQLEASLERMMRCGSGLCGLCAMDPSGLLVCKDGPVFDGSVLKTLTEFGNYARDFSGKKIYFKK